MAMYRPSPQSVVYVWSVVASHVGCSGGVPRNGIVGYLTVSG